MMMMMKNVSHEQNKPKQTDCHPGISVKNVGGGNFSCNDILYNFIKQCEFCFKTGSRVRTAQCL